MTVVLTHHEQALAAGEGGAAAALAMRMILQMAGVMGAPSLVPITRAHVDGCLYHGQVSVDFARALADAGGTVRVPTTLNVGAIDHLHPELFRGDPLVAAAARELRRLYAALGCRATWTCAPYQLQDRPGFGEQIAWAESNAIVFANSVLGARTERYGDFIDIAAGLTGRAPFVGLHTDEGRLGRVLVRVGRLPREFVASGLLAATLGHLIGRRVPQGVPVIEGVEGASEDDLKALGAAAASSGAIAMFHMVGVTPEAPSTDAAFGGRPPEATIDLTMDDFRAALGELSTVMQGALSAVSVGTPHFSFAEFEAFVGFLAGRAVSAAVECYVSTGRDVLAQIAERGWDRVLSDAGVRIVTDTCTYITPILRTQRGVVMTNSGKWAWYAPNNLGLDVVFGSLRECVESAVRGEIWRQEWTA